MLEILIAAVISFSCRSSPVGQICTTYEDTNGDHVADVVCEQVRDRHGEPIGDETCTPIE